MGNILLRSQSKESRKTEKYLKEKNVVFISLYSDDIDDINGGEPELFINGMAMPIKKFGLIKAIVDDSINYPGSLPQLFKK